MTIKYFLHESSYVEEGCRIGDNTKIWHFSHIMKDCEIGNNCVIGQNVFIYSGVRIGNRVKIQNNVSLYNGVVVEDDAFLGPSCVFTNVINPRAFIERKSKFRQTLIKRGASIGANATIVCGNEIGRYAIIGAGAVVTRHIPDYTVAYGNPARPRGYVCICGERLFFSGGGARCNVCNEAYRMLEDECIEKL